MTVGSVSFSLLALGAPLHPWKTWAKKPLLLTKQRTWVVCASVLGVSPASRPSPGTPTSPTALTSGLKTPVLGAPAAPSNPLANILSKVEITPESILSALSKTQTQTAPALQGTSAGLGGRASWAFGGSGRAEACCSAYPEAKMEGEKV